MKKYYIHHHLGLGDHFVCNGLVRFMCEKFGKVTTFAKFHNYETVKFMFRDNSNINVLPVENDSMIYQYPFDKMNPNGENYFIQVGFDNLWKNFKDPELPLYSGSDNFDVRFYEIMGLDFELRWNLFNTERDLTEEENFFKNFNIKKNEYVFVHDDERFQIDMNRVNTNLQVIKPIKGLTTNIYDYCYLIENACEVHTIESSFGLMIDSLNLSKEHYIHRYPRTDNPPVYRYVKEILL